MSKTKKSVDKWILFHVWYPAMQVCVLRGQEQYHHMGDPLLLFDTLQHTTAKELFMIEDTVMCSENDGGWWRLVRFKNVSQGQNQHPATIKQNIHPTETAGENRTGGGVTAVSNPIYKTLMHPSFYI